MRSRSGFTACLANTIGHNHVDEAVEVTENPIVGIGRCNVDDQLNEGHDSQQEFAPVVEQKRSHVARFG